MSKTNSPVGLLKREDAIGHLMKCSFTREEAERCLDEPDKTKRMEITLAVQQRVKEEQGK